MDDNLAADHAIDLGGSVRRRAARRMRPATAGGYHQPAGLAVRRIASVCV
jgi:hypothetical protein